MLSMSFSLILLRDLTMKLIRELHIPLSLGKK
jgi:hypothetical protein